MHTTFIWVYISMHVANGTTKCLYCTKSGFISKDQPPNDGTSHKYQGKLIEQKTKIKQSPTIVRLRGCAIVVTGGTTSTCN